MLHCGKIVLNGVSEEEEASQQNNEDEMWDCLDEKESTFIQVT